MCEKLIHPMSGLFTIFDTVAYNHGYANISYATIGYISVNNATGSVDILDDLIIRDDMFDGIYNEKDN